VTSNARRSTVVVAVVGVALSVVTAAAAASHAKPQPSKTFAGYEVSKPKTGIKSATAIFVVPTITCKKSFSGVGPSVVVQTKPNKHNVYSDDVAAVGVGCANKHAEYESIITIGSHSFNDFPFAAGDKVVATVKLTKSKTTVEVDDTTSGAHKTRTGRGGVGAIAYIGDQGLVINKKKTGLDPFTKTVFTNSEVNGKSLVAEKATAFERTRGKTVQIAVSKLSKGKDFDLTFTHS
jgi:hypothetical protein